MGGEAGGDQGMTIAAATRWVTMRVGRVVIVAGTRRSGMIDSAVRASVTVRKVRWGEAAQRRSA